MTNQKLVVGKVIQAEEVIKNFFGRMGWSWAQGQVKVYSLEGVEAEALRSQGYKINLKPELEDPEWEILVRVNFPDHGLGEVACEIGNNGRAKGQVVTTSQGFGHRHVLDKALIQLGTKDKLVLPIKQESPVLAFLELFFFLTSKVVTSSLDTFSWSFFFRT